MITAEQKRDWFLALIDQETSGPSPNILPWLDRYRRESAHTLATLSPPHRRQEDWRYSRIDTLFQQHFYPAVKDDLAALDITDYALTDTPSYRLVFVNGQCMPRLSNITEWPHGVLLGCLSAMASTDPELIASWYARNGADSTDVFSVLNSALPSDGAFVHIDRHTILERPIEVIHISQGNNQAFINPSRNLVMLEDGAEATLIEHFIGTDAASYFHNNLTEITLGSAAKLKHYRLQEESRNAYHLGNLYLSQQSHSDYHGSNLALGSAWGRTHYHVGFQHPEASCRLDGLYTVGDGQLIDTHLKLEHRQPGCQSRVNYKGILYGQGRAVFDGHIRVEQAAQKTDAQLNNKNLMLTRDAEVDTKPQLEIYADDVKCGHGTTVGQLDPQQVFYLCSRGIEPASARNMLCMGFAGEVLEGIDIPELRESVAVKIQDTLDTAIRALA